MICFYKVNAIIYHYILYAFTLRIYDLAIHGKGLVLCKG